MDQDGNKVAAFMHPPIGNYFTSPSSIDRHFGEERGGVRESCWGASWCCRSTRRDHDPKLRDKWLAAATRNGGARLDPEVERPSDEKGLGWKTYQPPTGEPAASSGSQGPPLLALPMPENLSGKDVVSNIPHSWVKTGSTWRVVRTALEGGRSSADPATTMASAPIDNDAETQPAQKTTKRQKRQLRQQKTQGQFRHMVDDAGEALQCARRVRALFLRDIFFTGNDAATSTLRFRLLTFCRPFPCFEHSSRDCWPRNSKPWRVDFLVSIARPS